MRNSAFTCTIAFVFMFLSGVALNVNAQSTQTREVSPCVNVTIHDLAPKIRHHSGADLLRQKGTEKVVVVTMNEWQGKTAFQEYFIRTLRQNYPSVTITRGVGYLTDYLYVTIEESDVFSLSDFQQSVTVLRTTIAQKEEILGTEKSLAEYEKMLK